MASVEARFVDELRQRMEKLSTSLISTPPNEIASVMKLHGEYVGIQFALDTLFNIKTGEEDGNI